ncbi:DNA polymerase epsilon subunit 3-like [Centruroides vittatus]
MAKSLDDFNLPQSAISKIVKHTLPDGISISNEAKEALSKAASVFVLYSTSCANNFALRAEKKTLTTPDIYAAMEDMNFGSFVNSLKESLKIYHTEKGKRDNCKMIKKHKLGNSILMEEEENLE